MSVVDAVQAEVDGLGDLADSALAATALALAAEIDEPGNSATSKSMCAKALMDALSQLRDLAPPKEKRGELHSIKSARSSRLSGRKSTA